MGDSVGRWEGDTLVVDTTNFTDKTRFRGSSQNLHVVERFTRVDDRRRCSIGSRSRIPTTWDRPWTGEYTWPATDELIYEYACHEGNYALGNILRGARLEEADARRKAVVRCEVRRSMRTTPSCCAPACCWRDRAGAAHHAFGGEFDAEPAGAAEGRGSSRSSGSTRTPGSTSRSTKPDGSAPRVWMVEGGTPNTLLRRGITRDSLKLGTEHRGRRLPGQGHAQARQRPQRHVPDGRKLFIGSSGTGAPRDGADPTEKGAGR